MANKLTEIEIKKLVRDFEKFFSPTIDRDYDTELILIDSWGSNTVNAIANQEVTPKLKEECAKTHAFEAGQFLCQRMGIAGRSVALMIQDLDHDSLVPKFETPEREVVRAINYQYPISQCRLDTFFQGAICAASENVEFSNSDETQGSFHQKSGDTR